MNTDVSTILYFSASGNCKLIADYFTERSGAKEINLTNYNERNNFVVDSNCMFILPVYNGAIPAVCAEYINKLNGNNKYACIVCVYGGVYKGNALQNAAGLLKKYNFIPLHGAYIAAPHTYSNKKVNVLDEKRLNTIYKNLFYADTHIKLKISDKPKGWDKQTFLKKLTGKCIVKCTCNNCGQCIKVCPVNAIGTDYKSNKNCILCGACIKICVCNARRIKFFTPFPGIFIKIKCKPREDQFFTFV